jgi:hypothetical protein
MTQEELENVIGSVGKEGFDYCFQSYSNFKEVKSKKFHAIRKKYLAAAEELENYLREQCEKNDLDYADLLG